MLALFGNRVLLAMFTQIDAEATLSPIFEPRFYWHIEGVSKFKSTGRSHFLCYITIWPNVTFWCLCYHFSGTAGPIFTKIFVQIPCDVARSFPGGVAMRYVFPVLWMTSCWAIIGRMAMRGRLNL